MPNNNSVHDFEVEHDFPEIGFKKMFLNAHMIPGEGDRPCTILLSIEDVTIQAEMEKELSKLKNPRH
ncbi:MAG: hypothetical protein ABSH41_25635 [Syntrophobacteraceae bacterium]|jgi:hypothetical protein